MRGMGSKEMKASVNVMRADGTDVRRVTDEQTVAFYGAWSPDSRLIAFTSSPDGERVAFVAGKFPSNAIYVMNADGSGVKKLTP